LPIFREVLWGEPFFIGQGRLIARIAINARIAKIASQNSHNNLNADWNGFVTDRNYRYQTWVFISALVIFWFLILAILAILAVMAIQKKGCAV
jgi:hypothetical protein